MLDAICLRATHEDDTDDDEEVCDAHEQLGHKQHRLKAQTQQRDDDGEEEQHNPGRTGNNGQAHRGEG